MFLLSDDTRFAVETEQWARPVDPLLNPRVFWQTNTHTPPPRLGLAILAGSQAVFEPVRVDDGDAGFFTIGAALPRISDDGLEVSLWFRPAGADAEGGIELARKLIASWDDSNPWEDIEINLDNCRGKTGSFVVACGAGPAGDPTADWAALYEFVVGPPEKRTLLRARAFRDWRAKNESEHFSSVHTPEYTPTRPSSGFGWFPAWLGGNPALSPPSASRYAGELLQKKLRRRIPDFVGLLRKKIRGLKTGETLRVLALCCGTAQKEAILMSHADGRRVCLTLMDSNEKLLEQAKIRLAPWCETRIAPCDLNNIDLQGEAFDVILCAAGLHHLIELERVAGAIVHGLRPGGEFWSISEYIGRPGARLWPEAYAMANPFFKALPEKYRVNALSGKPVAELPNLDSSVSTFEGIRAPEIEGVLAKWLQPVYLSRQACWLWRVFDFSAYGGNYDLRRREDRRLIQKAAAMDARFQINGGRPSGLNAVYTAR
jgi:SAM-dependent methyltransferase